MLVLRTLLVPVDFSETAEHALEAALDLARAVSAKVHVVHVYQIPVYGFPDGAFIAGPEVATRISEASQHGLDALVERHRARGIELGSVLRTGAAHEEIVACARDLGADMIVMGTHGRGAIAHALLGSVTERVVRISPVPVLTIRHREHRK
ncbi:MAG: universal stress protein [Polyangiales bacterium]